MTGTIQLVDPRLREDWDRHLLQWPGATVFHTRGWAQVLAGTYGYAPCYMALAGAEGAGALLPLMEVGGFALPRHGVSLPFTDACAPLVHRPEDGPALIAAALEHGAERGWRYAEFRAPMAGEIPAAAYYFHTVDLAGGEEACRARCKPAVQRAVRQAEARGVQVAEGTSEREVREFYRLHSLTRRHHGLPPQPYSFFESLRRHLLLDGRGTVVSARLGGEMVAGAVFLRFGASALFKFGASDRRYWSARPNDAVLWRGLCWSLRQGCRTLSLGRTAPANDGLCTFKRGWGAREQAGTYHRYDYRSGAYVHAGGDETGWHNRIFRALPLPMLQLAGRLFYRRAG